MFGNREYRTGDFYKSYGRELLIVTSLLLLAWVAGGLIKWAVFQKVGSLWEGMIVNKAPISETFSRAWLLVNLYLIHKLALLNAKARKHEG